LLLVCRVCPDQISVEGFLPTLPDRVVLLALLLKFLAELLAAFLGLALGTEHDLLGLIPQRLRGGPCRIAFLGGLGGGLGDQIVRCSPGSLRDEYRLVGRVGDDGLRLIMCFLKAGAGSGLLVTGGGEGVLKIVAHPV
jgi:hypothetical protein